MTGRSADKLSELSELERSEGAQQERELRKQGGKEKRTQKLPTLTYTGMVVFENLSCSPLPRKGIFTQSGGRNSVLRVPWER